jgi:hypothetical protein
MKSDHGKGSSSIVPSIREPETEHPATLVNRTLPQLIPSRWVPLPLTYKDIILPEYIEAKYLIVHHCIISSLQLEKLRNCATHVMEQKQQREIWFTWSFVDWHTPPANQPGPPYYLSIYLSILLPPIHSTLKLTLKKDRPGEVGFYIYIIRGTIYDHPYKWTSPNKQ